MSAAQTIYELIADVVGEGGSDDIEALTVEVLDKIGCPQKLRYWFSPILHNEIRRRRRYLVRNRSHDVEATVTPIRPLNRKPVGAASVVRPQFLRDTIETFGVWGRVAFGEMTVEMHESRIAGQLKLALGVKRDVDKHSAAIDRITAAGVACLNDLPEHGGKGAA